jgi:hypothetical protein
MSISTRSLAAAALTGILALSITAPAASAAGQGKGVGAAKSAPAKGTKTKPSKPAKPAKPSKALVAKQRAVTAQITRLDLALARQAGVVSTSGIAVAETVLANISGDRAVLAGYATSLAAATTSTEVAAVDALVRSLRPEVYSVVVNGLRQAAHFDEVTVANDATIAELTVAAAAKELEGHDVTAVRELLLAAQATNAEVPALTAAIVDRGVLLDALSLTADRAAFTDAVAAAGTALDSVAADLQLASDALAAMVPAEPEPVAEEPVVVEPVVVEPVVVEPVV